MIPALQGFFSTAGPGSVVGILIGWAVFRMTSIEVPCFAGATIMCTRAFGMEFLPFVIPFAAVGGLLGYGVTAWKD